MHDEYFPSKVTKNELVEELTDVLGELYIVLSKILRVRDLLKNYQEENDGDV